MVTGLAAGISHAADLPQPARAFLTAHCAECHDADTKKGDLDLSALSADLDNPLLEYRWTLVHDRVKRGEMPPKKEKSPPPAERDNFLQSLGGFINAHDAARQAATGRTVLRRLNRAEYENTVHDLLKIDIPLGDLLPEDASANGFDNVSQALRLSASQIDAYLQAADKALEAAIDLRPDPRFSRRISLLDIPDVRDELDRPFGYVQADGSRPNNRFSEVDDGVVIYSNDGTLLRDSSVPISGTYRVRVSMFAHQSTGHPVLVGRWMANNFATSRKLADLDLTPGEPRVAEFDVYMNQGEMLLFTPAGCTEKQADGKHWYEIGTENFRGAGVGIRWASITGPLSEYWPPPSVAQVFGDVRPQLMKQRRGERVYQVLSAQPGDDVEKVITGFASHAFRRPVSEDEVADYSRLAHDSLIHGATFEVAIRRACKAIMTSPRFLFLQESNGPLDDYALASRLSYFLWSTMPDEELSALARQGKLKDPATLHAQTDRMLKNPKSHAFTANFCGQWLNLRAIDATMPDQELYPEYDILLKDSMIGETEAFFDQMLKEDLGVKTLIDSDFAMLNRRIAEHYGIPGVLGEQFRKVPLPPGSHRGGILTQAAILKVTANGTVSSPVVRGAFVVKRILGRQLQPPPANAGSIEPDTRGATTIREQLAKHRRMASCSVCHQYMDPPGFALENYDVIGGFRPWYRVHGNAENVEMIDPTSEMKRNFHKGPPIDASGEMDNGRQFVDISELKELLLDQRSAIAENLTNNLVTYATGAAVSFADRQQVQAILQKAEPHGYGLRTLVDEIVQSRLFQTK